MKNKNLLFKFGLASISVLCLGLSFVAATSFTLNLPKSAEAYGEYKSNSIVPIHFADKGNDFGGFMYITDFGTEDDEEDGGDSSKNLYMISGVDSEGNETQYECVAHVRGFYYNSERGERLWPLDDETAAAWKDMQIGLTTEGGIYTSCRPAGYSQKVCEVCQKGEWINDECDCPEWDEDEQVCKTQQQAPTCDEEPCPEPEMFDSAACVRDLDIEFESQYTFYGKVKHNYEGQKFGFVIGTDYKEEARKDKSGNPVLDDRGHEVPDFFSIKTENGEAVLASTFLMAFGQVPMGFVYDYNGGLGFAGCEIKDVSDSRSTYDVLRKVILGGKDIISMVFAYSDGVMNPRPQDPQDPSQCGTIGKCPDLSNDVECKNIGVAANSLIKVIVEGIVGMSRESKLDVMGNENDAKMQYFSSSNINNSTLVGYAKKRSEVSCRGKWKSFDYFYDKDPGAFPGNEICIDLNNNGVVSADLAKLVKESGKTLVVKNGDVVVKPFDSDEVLNDKYYDIFVNNGNLIIDETGADKFAFTRQGFVAKNSDGILGITEFIKDIEDNTLNGYYQGDLSGVGSFIRGNFIIDGHVKGVNDSKLNNKFFIHGKFTVQDSFEDLKNVFIWKCTNGYVKDKEGNILESQGKYCPQSMLRINVPGNNGSEEGYAWQNTYDNASLVIIDQNYKSPLYW